LAVYSIQILSIQYLPSFSLHHVPTEPSIQGAFSLPLPSFRRRSSSGGGGLNFSQKKLTTAADLKKMFLGATQQITGPSHKLVIIASLFGMYPQMHSIAAKHLIFMDETKKEQ